MADLDEVINQGDSNLDAVLETPAPAAAPTFDDHMAAFDQVHQAAVHGFGDASGFHQVDGGGNVIGEPPAPAFGSFADRWNPNEFGSIQRRDLESNGIETANAKPFEFNPTANGGRGQWQFAPRNIAAAPRKDLRYDAFPTAPQGGGLASRNPGQSAAPLSNKKLTPAAMPQAFTAPVSIALQPMTTAKSVAKSAYPEFPIR